MYDLPPQVLRAMEMLNAAGHRAYLVGRSAGAAAGQGSHHRL